MSLEDGGVDRMTDFKIGDNGEGDWMADFKIGVDRKDATSTGWRRRMRVAEEVK